MKKQLYVFLLMGAVLLAACSAGSEPVEVDPTVCPEVPDCPECPEAEPCPEPLVDEIPFLEKWVESGHADREAEAFRHWDEDENPVVAASCAKCHSTAGYLDFHGVDGSQAGAIDVEPSALENEGITCVACHNDVVVKKDSVVMPSGAELTGLGGEARCMECHQGRESALSVDGDILEAAAVEDLGEVDLDAVLEELGFVNIHYYAAAASKYGTLAQGGYEYAGKSYDGNFSHVEEYDTCQECHDSHTLEVKTESCVSCHGEGELLDYRMVSSAVDYDGDGDLEEGIAYEIEGLQVVLYAEMQTYAAESTGNGLLYDSQSYPYFFMDTNNDGEASEDEVNYGNQFKGWTPRLLRAAYNFQVSKKDPGGFAHGGKYIIQLLFDSIEDLNPAAAAGLNRNDHGHFMGSAEAFRHWDEDGEVPGTCSKCHSADGLPLYLTQGVTINQPISNGFQCDTCHGGGEFPSLYFIDSVTFPSGETVSVGADNASGLCMTCHQGSESAVSVRNAVDGLAPDDVSDQLEFINIHYFAAAATRYGTEAQGGYEFAGKEYAGLFEHVEGYQTCVECHDAHELEVETGDCATCHGGEENTRNIRMSEVDYDGDGNVEEGMAGEIETMTEALYAALQSYAAANSEPIVYDAHRYPYFFVDTNGDGITDPGEANYGNQYGAWTPTLLEVAYNFQLVQKDPGAYVHNSAYILQLLYDSIEAAGGSTAGMTRP